MLESYEINCNTLAIVPVNTKVSKIIEKEKVLLVNKKSVEIIDESCRFFGSTFEGRHQGTKEMIGVTYKSPIIIEESQSLIFFPTSSPRYNNCYWLSLNNIKSSEKYENFCKVKFNNNYKLVLNISYESLKLQILRATMLESTIKKRRNFQND